MPITPYLKRLATDERLLRKHKRNPKGTAMDEGLTQEEADLVASGDLAAIDEALQAENPGKKLSKIVMIAE